MGSGFFTYPEVQDFTAGVDGQIAPTTVITVPNPQGQEQPPVRWAAFDVTFPLTREVVISVSYSISPTGYLPEAQFAYVLSTGAGWYGTIGQVDITMRLPYPANLENVILNNTTRGARFQSGTVRWQRTNLEPTASDDWHATILATNIWEAILDARQAELAAPRDAQKWLALSQAYVQAVPYKYVPSGGEHFQLLAVRAMQIAVSLSPNSAIMRTEYASLLWYLYHVQVVQNPQGRLANIIHYNLNMALKLDPNDAKAKQLQQEIDRELSQG
jgi:hypothetical protein